jgi:putative two-component system hydrogenase maturation factor HypX/HoxX
VPSLASNPALKPQVSQKKTCNILFFSNSDNSLTQRVGAELKSRGHSVTKAVNPSPTEMVETAKRVSPDLILCPFLTKRIPESLYKSNSTPCLIVHPGIEGDRGASSIDWALKEKADEWGVTVLQADDEMDAGDIYATQNFKIDRLATKSSLYMNEVTQSAVDAVLKAVDNYVNRVQPRPLDYTDSNVKGTLKPNMTPQDRVVDWSQSAEEISRTIRMSDSQPGARLTTSNGETYVAFGAHVENNKSLIEHVGAEAEPGEIIARRDGAVLFKCSDEKGVWVSHMKQKPGKKSLKLPSTLVLADSLLKDARVAPSPPLELPFGQTPDTFQEIWTTRQGEVVYLHSNFYNGAMSTEQCNRLTNVVRQISLDPSCKVVVFMGGRDYFSNGIHLNMIEQATHPAAESWANINAINDFVREIFSMKDKVTVAAVQGNAGAGGAMVPLAADLVWTHGSVVINPHYKSMHLFGSEYWTHFLPKRVGHSKALSITSTIQPMLATKAVEIGMYDKILSENRDQFSMRVSQEARKLAVSHESEMILKDKKARQWEDWLGDVEKQRKFELDHMKDNFEDPDYHQARSSFVYH